MQQLMLQSPITLVLDRPPLPALIEPHPTPFDVGEDERWITLDDARLVLGTCNGIIAAMKEPGHKSPITAMHLAEHIVGLHRRLLDGRMKLTRVARSRVTANQLMQALELAYDALEPLCQ